MATGVKEEIVLKFKPHELFRMLGRLVKCQGDGPKVLEPIGGALNRVLDGHDVRLVLSPTYEKDGEKEDAEEKVPSH